MKFRNVCVLGMGYIGLPTASTLATNGVPVIGVDINQRVVEILRDGRVHISEPGLETLVQQALDSGRLEISEQPQTADAFLIAVPTPLADDKLKRADLGYVEEAVRSIVPVLESGNLVVIESTCPPRTTVDVVAPILEASGLRAGDDFFLAYTPERVLPGRILQELVENDRVIGGINPASAEAARDLYKIFVEGELVLTDATTAEMVKLMENTYRDVNIAVANEFSHLAEKLDVNIWEAIDHANRHPRVEVLRPGPGVGGHCISIDPWFLVESAVGLTPLIRQARQVNDAQPVHTAEWMERMLGGLQGTTVAALGLAYKAGVDDVRESPAVGVIEVLVERGANVKTYDPFAKSVLVEGAATTSSLEDAMADAEALVLLVDHPQFLEITPEYAAGLMSGRTAFDTRGRWDRTAWQAAGFVLHTLGTGSHDE